MKVLRKKKQNNFLMIAKKWQKIWKKNKLYQTKNFSKKPKYYVLNMFPYPSGAGLHIGHPRSYTATDILYRYYKMKGFNVLQPMGWDAFGLPAENYAIKTGIHPAISTKKNIQHLKKQLQSLGFAYDWSREIDTSSPAYYKWTQWTFLKMFEKGLAYISEAPINWCPSCKTGLANEEVVNGKCSRCGTDVIRKTMKQWMLKITAYAQQLLDGLDQLDWPESIKIMQRNWIGKSSGAEIRFAINNSQEKIDVFTTRIDTIFGVTALVLAPEHPLVKCLISNVKCQKLKIKNQKEVEKYIAQSQRKSELERTELQKEKTGVQLKGVQAINPATGEKIPVWVGDYVIATYGGGAVMVVPAHDQRDYDFALRYKLAIKEVIRSKDKGPKRDETGRLMEAYEGEGTLINSGEFSGQPSEKARERLIKWLSDKKLAKQKINYRFRDWIFSRQRYWGEPIPLVYCQKCKEKIIKKKYKPGEFNQGELLNPGWIALREKDLPLVLPRAKDYKPTGTGQSPLAKVKSWVETSCPKCGAKAYRETNVMPQWAGSCWYYLRYVDPKNKKVLIDKKKENYWLPVDMYVGGAEHAVLHLLYARFWHKVLYDLKVVHTKEPFMSLRNQGMVLGEDGEKMSKSRGNTVDPDQIVKKYGPDVLRVYEMFMGPFEAAIPWSATNIEGINRFLKRISKLMLKKICNLDDKLKRDRHQTIKKVTKDILNFKFNTAISCLMTYLNKIEKRAILHQEDLSTLLLLLSPFAPHLSEELWHQLHPELKKSDSIFETNWPEYEEKLTQSAEAEIIVQINGRLRDKIIVNSGVNKEEIKKMALESPKIQKYLNNQQIKKIIFVPDRLINFVI